MTMVIILCGQMGQKGPGLFCPCSKRTRSQMSKKGKKDPVPFAQKGRKMKKIVLLRHGESAWNKENRFTKQFQQADSMFNQKYLLE